MGSAGPLGVIANPASGKDIRRVVARASVFDNQEKQAIVRRAIAGALAAGAREVLYMPDGHGIVEGILGDFAASEARFEPLESPQTDSPIDTVRAARQLKERAAASVITLGGDGTNRAVVIGWREVPLVALSTGTNNVFPRMLEGTVAGSAAGLVAAGVLGIEEVAAPSKTVQVEIEGERDDIALIDAVFLEEMFIGARAIWDPSRLRAALLTRAEPAVVGISSLGGLLDPVASGDDAGLWLAFGPGGGTVNAPLAPGMYRSIPVALARRVALDEAVTLEGPGVLAFDGERERVLKPGQRATLRVRRDGPRVIDVDIAMRLAAQRGQFRSGMIGEG